VWWDHAEDFDSGIKHFTPSIRDVITTTGLSDVESLYSMFYSYILLL